MATTRETSSAAGSEQLKKLKYYLKNYPVEALLMSAGGNDLAAGSSAQSSTSSTAGATWQSAVKLATLTTVLDDIVASYGRLLDARDSLRPELRGGRAQLLLLPAYRPQGHRAVRPGQRRAVDASGAEGQGHRPG